MVEVGLQVASPGRVHRPHRTDVRGSAQATIGNWEGVGMFHSIDQVVERIQKGKRFLVVGHVGPDGDDVSCVASLVMILRKAGMTAEGCIADRIPGFFHRLSDADLIRNVEDLHAYTFDTSITVDASEPARIGDAARLLGGGIPDITLDHHQTNRGFGVLNFCDPSYAAAAMIVQEIGERLVDLDPATAEMLLLGIASDTGFFRFTSVDERVFDCAAALIRAGANIGRIAEAVLEHRTLSEVRLRGRMFDTLELSADGRLATAHVTADLIEETGCTEEDTYGMVGELRSLHGVEVAIVFVESPRGTVNASLRSKNRVDVSQIALRFGGGGHVPAAGFSQPCTQLEDLMKDVIADAVRTIEQSLPGQG